jgi:hypothetical protein
MTFSHLIEQWPSLAELAADIGQKPEAVQKWKQRNSVPSVHWLALIDAAKRRGIKLSMETLAQIQSQQRAA